MRPVPVKCRRNPFQPAVKAVYTRPFHIQTVLPWLFYLPDLLIPPEPLRPPRPRPVPIQTPPAKRRPPPRPHLQLYILMVLTPLLQINLPTLLNPLQTILFP